ncbi:MAG: zinc ribbon domain-containing protein [Pyrinomonadaceae bacterium]
MYCPKCGESDQTPETYCRQCGIFLPDIDKPTRRETPPERHLLISTVLNIFSILVSLTLAFILYSMNIRLADSAVIIYVVAGFLLAMAIWQVQILYRTAKLKKFIKKNKTQREAAMTGATEATKSLGAADFLDIVPASVTERTTKNLSTKTEHQTD